MTIDMSWLDQSLIKKADIKPADGLATPRQTATEVQLEFAPNPPNLDRADALLSAINGTIEAQSALMREEARRLLAEHMAKPGLDEIKRAVTKVVSKLKQGIMKIEVQVKDLPVVEIDGLTHEAFSDALALIAAGMPVALIGPSGCGKTHMMEQVAKAIQARRFVVSSLSGMSSTGDILGRVMLVDGGKTTFVPSGWLDVFQNGGLWLGDEYDAVDPSVGLVLNAAHANGYIDIPQWGEHSRVVRHKDYHWGVAMNTFGRGANRMYVGRQAQDEAAIDRFRIGQIEMDYDRKLEEALAGDCPELLKAIWKIRDKANEEKLRRVVSTRFIIHARTMMLSCNWTLDQAIKQLTMGWSYDELSRIGRAGDDV